MDPFFTETLMAGGPIAILAYLIFHMYRRDRKSSAEQLREDRKYMEDRLSKIIEEDQNSREANTKALTELIVLLKHMNGN